MNIRVPQSGKAARIAKAYLKTLGIELKHAQSLELIARLHGYSDNQAMQADMNFLDPLVLRAEGSSDFVLTTEKQSSVYVTVENISVYIKKDDEGVSVDLFPLGGEMGESIASTYALYDEANLCCDKCGSELDDEGYCTDATCPYHDWPQAVCVQDLQELSTQEVENKHGVAKRSSDQEALPKDAPKLFTYHFEAEGFIETRAQLKAVPEADLSGLQSKYQAELEHSGFTALRQVYLTADEAQDDTEIKVFVVVELEGFSTAGASDALLERLSQAICRNQSGHDVVGSHSWELANLSPLN